MDDVKLLYFAVKLQFIKNYALKGYIISYIGDNKFMLKSPEQYKLH
jgi:hypothetical protein